MGKPENHRSDFIGNAKLLNSHLCFADDLMIFAQRDINTAKTIKATINKFFHMSVLRPNMDRSNIFVSHQDIIDLRRLIFWYNIGSFPMNYLGVLSITGKLKGNYCTPLLEKVYKEIGSLV